MAMSKKDYIAIAAVMASYHEQGSAGVRLMVEHLADDLSRVFAADNPRFDHDRFLSAVKKYPATASSF